MKLSRYTAIYPARQRPGHFLVFSTLRSSTVLISEACLEAIETRTLPPQQTEALARVGILVDDPEAEREALRGMVEQVGSQSRTFKPIVVLNLDCNLNCGYCYEGNFRGGHYMSNETADLVVEALIGERISRGWNVAASFYGGEPLLSRDLIRRISEPLFKAAEKHGVKYGFSLVTNGTLLSRKTAEELLPLGLSGAKFTLDGPREIHDLERPYPSGAGSYDAVVENLAEVVDLVPIQLGGNFRRENYRAFPKVLDDLVARGIAPSALANVQFTPVTPKAGCSEYGSGCMSSSEPWLVEALVYLRGEILSRGFRTTAVRPSACTVELQDNVVISCEGKYYKCPALMGYEGYQVGSLETGIRDYRDSHGIGNWQKEECLDCRYLPICFGGCRFLTKLKGEELSEVDCRREFYDAALERMILQNLAYQPASKRPAPVAPSEAAAAGAY